MLLFALSSMHHVYQCGFENFRQEEWMDLWDDQLWYAQLQSTQVGSLREQQQREGARSGRWKGGKFWEVGA